MSELSCHTSGREYRACSDSRELEEEQRRRRSLLDGLWLQRPGGPGEERFRERVLRLRQLLQDFLLELHTLCHVTDSISRRYLEGEVVLFPGVAEWFQDLVDHTEKLAQLFNRNLGDEMVSLQPAPADCEGAAAPISLGLDLGEVARQTEHFAPAQVTYLVDMAKVEALDALGENRRAVELLERHV